MKKILFPLIAVTVCCCLNTAKAQEHKEHISKTFTAKNGQTLAIYNVFGFIKVEGYNGDKVQFEVDKTISAKTNDDLETGKKEFKMEFEQVGDTIWAYIVAPYDSRPRQRYNDWDERRRIEYRYELDFTVKVPHDMDLAINTVNNGDISVKDVNGKLKVRNVNGAISVVNAKGISDLRTVNGDVTVNYTSNPSGASYYNTINGAIRATYKPDLAADLEFKSMNGSYYTDFDNVEALNNAVVKNTEDRGNGTVYKLNKNTAIRIGKGGNTFKFETLNGNIYIKKQAQ